jgi:hypothetical protein
MFDNFDVLFNFADTHFLQKDRKPGGKENQMLKFSYHRL